MSKDYSQIGLGSTSLEYDLILVNQICNDSVSKEDYTVRYWGLGLQHMSLEEDTVEPTQMV